MYSQRSWQSVLDTTLCDLQLSMQSVPITTIII
jgi:hypothetical protein